MDINEVVQRTAEETVQRVAEPIVRSAVAAALREITRQLEGAAVVPVADVTVQAVAAREPYSRPDPRFRKPDAPAPIVPVRPKDALSVSRAAKLAKVTPKTVYNAIETGKLVSHLVPAPKRARRGAKDGMVRVVSAKAVKAWRGAAN